jgi:hypothetical protein
MKRENFTLRRFILTEGFEDSAFATAVLLLRNPRLPEMEVDSVDNIGDYKGKDGFEDAIVAATGKRGFRAITDVILLADNDENPDASFNHILNQIQRANARGIQKSWAVPNAPGERASGDPSVSIWMWPEPGTPGCMETLLWRVITKKHAAKAKCIEQATSCMEANNWPIQKQDKAKVRAFLALHNRRSPLVRFDVLWRDYSDILPIDRVEFNAFAAFLRSFR